MTLLEAVSTQDPHSIEHSLADALQGVPGAYALVTTKSLAGTNAICVLDENIIDFWDAEIRAITALLDVRRANPHVSLDLLCVSMADARGMEFPDDGSQIYRLA